MASPALRGTSPAGFASFPVLIVATSGSVYRPALCARYFAEGSLMPNVNAIDRTTTSHCLPAANNHHRDDRVVGLIYRAPVSSRLAM